MAGDGRCWQKAGYSGNNFENVLLTNDQSNCGIWQFRPGLNVL